MAQFTITLPPKELVVGSGYDSSTILTNSDGNQDVRLFEDPFLQYNYWDSVPGNIGFPAGSQSLAGRQDYAIQYANIGFYRWMRSKNYVMGKQVGGNDLQSVFYLNVFEKTATGQWRAVGKPQIWPDSIDSTFWAFACILATVATAGIASAATAGGGTAGISTSGVNTTISAGSKVVAGDTKGALIGIAQSYLTNGVAGGSSPAASVAVESPKVDDLDFSNAGFGDYDPVDYSSGESWTAFSDGQNVDFGFDYTAPDFTAATVDESGISISDENYSHEGYDYNSTAESNVSAYGDTSQGNSNYIPDDSSKLGVGPAAALPVAAAIAKGASPVNQSTNTSGGGAKYSQTAGSVASALAQATAQSQGSAPNTVGLSGLAQQLESVVKNTFGGQLGANKAVPTNTGMSTNTILLVGGGLIVVALLLHMKG